MCLVRYAHWCNSAMDAIVVTNHFLFGPPSAQDETHGWHSYQEQESVAMQIIGYSTSLLPKHNIKPTPNYSSLNPQITASLKRHQKRFFLKRPIYFYVICIGVLPGYVLSILHMYSAHGNQKRASNLCRTIVYRGL